MSIIPSLSHTASVLDVLLSESRLLSGLTDLGLSLPDTLSVVQTPVHSQVQSFAVDTRSELVMVSRVNNSMWPLEGYFFTSV